MKQYDDKKKNFSNKKKHKSNIMGFTLVELLAVIAVLSIVLTIVVYSILNIINNSKEKSYLVTINNVQEIAGNYVLEDMTLIPWEDEGSYQYQCITIQNLIDAGYFKGDVLESYVDDDIKLQASDYIYLERDVSNKAITKNVLLVGNRMSYIGLCQNINNKGNISFMVSPSGWAKEKNITIYYKLYNGNIDMHKYNYNYVLEDGSVDKKLDESFIDSSIYKKLTVNDNGTLYAKIKDEDNLGIVEKSLVVTKIDNEEPTAEISSTNNVASSQIITLSMNDSDSGVKSYYFGKTNPKDENVEWVSVVATSEADATATGEINTSISEGYSSKTTLSESGTWYLGVKDVAGNMTVVSKKFYTTALSMTNGSIEPNSILTMEGNEFTIPIGTTNGNYTFWGWYTSGGYSGDVITKYKPTKNSTLYAKVSNNTYTITLDSNGATTAGTDKIYEKYGEGIYLDSDNNKLMSTSSNKITVPTRTGYIFGGFYYGTSTNDYVTKMIDSSGYITSDFTNKYFSEDTTLVAKWIANTYVVSYECDGEMMTDYAQEFTYGQSYMINEQLCGKNGYKFLGWYDSKNNNWSNSDGTGKSGTWSYVSGQYGITNDNKLDLVAKFAINTYTITLDSQDATTDGTSKIFLKYGTGVYLDNGFTKKMSTSSNKIIVPTKNGYMFLGYYMTLNSMATADANIQLINETGYITDNFYNDLFSDDATIYAVWSEEHTHVWDAVGNTLRTISSSPFTCGFDHTRGYERYCSICQMSVKYYRSVIDTTSTKASMICPCNPKSNSLANVIFDDSSVSKAKNHGGLTMGDDELPVVTSIKSYCGQH